MPTDADNAFHIRAVSVRDLGDEGHEELSKLFQTLPWNNRGAAHLMVRMNGGTYS